MLDIWAIVGAVFMLCSVTISFYEIISHLCNFSKPYLQRYIIRILLMVPIYSMNAWIVMIFPESGLYLDSLREVYESFVIYSFMRYLLNFLKYDTNLQQYLDHKPGPSHIFPFCLLPTCTGGKLFMIRCKHGILQYVVVRPMTTLVAFASKLFNFYGEGNYNPLSGYTYPVLLIVNNLSQVMAMYCLVIFYTGYIHELAPMRPLAKFFSIKLVVFFSFFQSVVISSLMEINVVEETFRDLFPELNDKISLSRKLQEFLICFEMILAAITHLFSFSHKLFIVDDDYNTTLISEEGQQQQVGSQSVTSSIDGGSSKTTCCEALFNILDFSDEKSDVNEHFNEIFTRIKSLFRRRKPLPTIVSSPQTPMNNDWMVNRSVAATTSDSTTRNGSLGVNNKNNRDTAKTLDIKIDKKIKSYQSID